MRDAETALASRPATNDQGPRRMTTMIPRCVRLLPLLALLALLGAAGCSDDPSPAAPQDRVTVTDADDLAQQVGASLAADNGGMLTMMTASGDYDTSTKCQAGRPQTSQVNGLTYTVSWTFYDAQDAVQEAYNPLTTVRLVTDVRAAGAIETPRYQAAVGYAAMLDVAGIAAWQDTLRFNGTAHDTLQSSFASLDSTRTRYAYLESSAALENVVFAKPPAPDQWPLRGTASYAVVFDRLRSNERADVEAHFAASVVVRFNGTRYVPIEIDGTWTYLLDLKTGAVTRPTA
jgi:hypothetical protein